MRSTRPDTGAETTNRSRTRVIPSSSIVTTSGPRDTAATSTGERVVGHSADGEQAAIDERRQIR